MPEHPGNRVNNIKSEIKGSTITIPQLELKFVLSHPIIIAVIPRLRNPQKETSNTVLSELKPLPKELLTKLRKHV